MLNIYLFFLTNHLLCVILISEKRKEIKTNGKQQEGSGRWWFVQSVHHSLCGVPRSQTDRCHLVVVVVGLSAPHHLRRFHRSPPYHSCDCRNHRGTGRLIQMGSFLLLPMYLDVKHLII